MKEGDYIFVFDNRNRKDEPFEPIVEGTIVKIHDQKNGTLYAYLNTGYTIEISEL